MKKIRWRYVLAGVGLAIFLSLTIGCGVVLDFGIDSSGGYGYEYDNYGYYDYRYPYRLSCSRFFLGSEERRACEDGRRMRERDWQNSVYHNAREHGYQRGINGFPDGHVRYCRGYYSLAVREFCENGYRGGYGTGHNYYLEGLRNRSRRGYW